MDIFHPCPALLGHSGDMVAAGFPAIVCEMIDTDKYWAVGSLSSDLGDMSLTEGDMICSKVKGYGWLLLLAGKMW